MLKSIIIILTTLSLGLTSVHARVGQCHMANLVQGQLQELYKERSALIELQQGYLEAQKIREQLSDSQNTREILMLAERIQESVNTLESSQKANYVQAGAGLGAIMISSYIMKSLAKSAKGLTLKKKIQRQLKPTGPGGVVRTLTNSAFFVGVISSLWMVYRINDTKTNIEILNDVVLKLDKLKDLSLEIEKLDEDMNEIEARFDLMIDDVLYEKQGEVDSSGNLTCF